MGAIKLLSIATICLSLIEPLLAKRVFDCESCGLEHLLKSPAIGIDINTECLTAAIKHTSGNVTKLAKISSSVELQELMRGWARDPISIFPENDFFEDPLPDRDPLTPEAFVLQSSLAALIDQVTAQVPDLDLQQQRHAISLPPFVNRRHFHHVQQAAHMVGLTGTKSGWVDHSDRMTHMMYNALFCTYHMHPHNPLCATGQLEGGIFDALIIDYNPSFLTITWIDTFSPLALRQGGFVDSELGARLDRDREYWVKMNERIKALVRSLEEERRHYDRKQKESPQVGPNHLIFLGESSTDELLRSFLHEAFRGTRFDFNTVTIHDSYDAVFAGSIAAAVIEKAIMNASTSRNCEESIKCKDSREKIFEEALQGGGSKLEL